jgi:hypothetical protein
MREVLRTPPDHEADALCEISGAASANVESLIFAERRGNVDSWLVFSSASRKAPRLGRRRRFPPRSESDFEDVGGLGDART